MKVVSKGKRDSLHDPHALSCKAARIGQYFGLGAADYVISSYHMLLTLTGIHTGSW